MSQVHPKRSLHRNKSRGVRRRQPKRFAKKFSSDRRAKGTRSMNSKGRKSARNVNEYPAEYELHAEMDLQRPVAMRVINSNNSVIFVKSFPPKENIPVIDLTKSNHSFNRTTAVNSKSLGSNTSLKLIYKSKNFGKTPKPQTTSLLTIPMKRKLEKQRQFCSTSKLTRCSKEKIASLNLPSEYYDEDTDCSEYSVYDSSKADLNDEDKKMVDYIIMNENDKSSVNSNHQFVRLDAKQPLENICRMYGVSSKDTFN